MNEESAKLECGHRNDMPHLLTLIAAKLLWGGILGPMFKQIPENLRSTMIEELQESITSAFKHAGVADNEIDGARVFAAVKNERLQAIVDEEFSGTVTFNPNVRPDV